MAIRSATGSPLFARNIRFGDTAFRRALAAEFTAHRPVFILAALYILAALALSAILPGDQPLAIFLYAGLWLKAGLCFGFLFLAARTLPGILRDRPDRPLLALSAGMARYLTAEACIGVALIATQTLIMGTFTSVKAMLPDIASFSWDMNWADVDWVLSLSTDPWRYFAPLVSRPAILHVIEVSYLTGWMLMIAFVPAIVALAPRFAPIRLRFFLTYLLCWILLGNFLALAGMSAGPAFFGAVTGDGARFAPLLDYLAANRGSEYSAFDLQNALWQTYETKRMALGTGISAFPSLHVAMATLWVIVGFVAGRIFALGALAFLLFILAASVALGWHYAIDGYASIVLTVLIWMATGKALAILRARKSAADPAAFGKP